MKNRTLFFVLMIFLNLGIGSGYYNLRHEILSPALFCAVEPAMDGSFRVYYDLGAGFNERDTANANLSHRDNHRPIRIVLPKQDIRAVRIDPVDVSADVTLVDPGFGLFDNFMLHRIEAGNIGFTANIASWKFERRRLQIQVLRGSNDPYLVLTGFKPLLDGARADVSLLDRIYRIVWAALNLLFVGLFYWWVRR